jgi:hypothetical protein
MNWDNLVGMLKAPLVTPHGVSSRGAAIELVSGVLKHEADVEVWMLRLDPQMLGAICGIPQPLRFYNDTVGQAEVGSVLADTRRNFIFNLETLVLVSNL